MNDESRTGPDGNTTFWQGWGRLQTRVEVLGQSLDHLSTTMSQTFERLQRDMREGAREDRAQLTAAMEKQATMFMEALKMRDDAAKALEQENKDARHKTTILWTGIVLIGVPMVMLLVQLVIKKL